LHRDKLNRLCVPSGDRVRPSLPYLRRKKLRTKCRGNRGLPKRRWKFGLLDAFDDLARSMTWRDGVRVFVHRCGRCRAAASAAPCGPVARLVVTSILVTSLVAGCSTLIVDPGHYSVYHCDGLVARLKVLLDREQELSNLMERASEGGGGFLIGNMSYRADYENTMGEERVLRRTAAEKKCELPAPAGPTSPTPAVYGAPPPPAAYTSPPPAGTPIFQSDQTIR
jgi:hypothetical protein